MAIGGLLMPYQLTIEERSTYVYAKVTGERTPANALRCLRCAFAKTHRIVKGDAQNAHRGIVAIYRQCAPGFAMGGCSRHS